MEDIIKGFLLGIIITVIAIWIILPNLLIKTYTSTLDFDETISSIQSATITGGWQVPKIYDMEDMFYRAGFNDMEDMNIIALTQPDYSYELLKADSSKKISALMPCRISVYKNSTGDVKISIFNTSLLGKMFGGKAAKLMPRILKEQRDIIKNIVAY
ncbi:MAG: DUF302 domain-containing protein [Candidatus Omnitrophota bacterium]